MASKNRCDVETIFTGTILVQTKPRIERRDHLVHFIGVETGIRLAMVEDLFLSLTVDARAVASEIKAERAKAKVLRFPGERRKH